MTLYCRSCNRNHYFTPGEVERIVYTLAAAETDARCAPNGADRHHAGTDSMTDEPRCLRNIVGDSHDGEMYGEHVNAEVEARRHHGGAPTAGADQGATHGQDQNGEGGHDGR